MARIAGRNARLYMAITSGGTAEPIATVTKFNVDVASERFEVTALGDANKQYVQGLADMKGSISGVFDDASQQLYTAATDGKSRKFYFYSDTTNAAAPYWYGLMFVSESISFDVGGAVEFSGDWAASGNITRIY